MKISKSKIAQFKEEMAYNGDEVFGTKEVIDDTIYSILAEKGFGCCYPDEIDLTDGTNVITLDVFVESFWDKSIEMFFNFITSE